MPNIAIGLAIGLAAALWLPPAAALAECKDLQQFIKDETAGADKYVDTFSFRKNRRTESVLMLVKATVEKGVPPKRWLFLHRDDPTSSDFCTAGRGEEFGHYDDEHEDEVVRTFGPIGSNHPNCAISTDEVNSADELRTWANHDLGESIILTATAADTHGFQFVIGKDRDWIIVENRVGPPKQSCYFDRGTDVMMRFNIKFMQY